MDPTVNYYKLPYWNENYKIYRELQRLQVGLHLKKKICVNIKNIMRTVSKFTSEILL